MHAPACNVANRECISICTHFYFSMHAYVHRKQHLLVGTNFTMWRKIVHYSGCMLYLLRSDTCVMSASSCNVCTSRVLWALTSDQCGGPVSDGQYEQSAVWSEIQFWSDKTRPLVAEADHPGPPGIQSAEQIIHNKWVDKRWHELYLMFYNPHFKFEMGTCYFLYSVLQIWLGYIVIFRIWLGYMSYSVFDPVGALSQQLLELSPIKSCKFWRKVKKRHIHNFHPEKVG